MALTDAEKEAQLRAVGWTPSAGDSVAAAWARTATPADQAAGNAPAQNAFNPQAFAQQITSAMTPLSQATSGVTAADLAERKRQFDATLEWTKQMWANQGLPQLQIQQQAAQLAQQEFEQQKMLAAQNQAIAEAGVTGYYTRPAQSATSGGGVDASVNMLLGKNPALANPAYQQQLLQSRGWVYWPGENLVNGRPTTGTYPGMEATTTATDAGQPIETLASRMAKANLGLDYLKTAASMGGPADVFQADDFARGAAANGTPAFLNALRNNTGLAPFGATSGAAPTPMTAGGLMDRLGGVASPDHSAALNAIGGIAQAGGGALAPQAIESLDPDELAAMQSGFKKLGYSMPAFLQQYQQSRIGQGAAQAA